jgi:hypothetical protein
VTTFYAAFAPLSFTVLGLWFVVVQTRHREWASSLHHRRQASAVSLQLALPGLMSLLSLVAPTSTAMWRASFATAALVGAGALVYLAFSRTNVRPSPFNEALRWGADLLFVLVALVALRPRLVHDIGLNATGLQVEAVLLSLLVFLGVTVAWFLMFEEAPPVTP